jgi:hypothetical protein
LSLPIASWTLPGARLKFAEIGQQPLLVLVADRPILLHAQLAAAEDMDLVADNLPRDGPVSQVLLVLQAKSCFPGRSWVPPGGGEQQMDEGHTGEN